MENLIMFLGKLTFMENSGLQTGLFPLWLPWTCQGKRETIWRPKERTRRPLNAYDRAGNLKPLQDDTDHSLSHVDRGLHCRSVTPTSQPGKLDDATFTKGEAK